MIREIHETKFFTVSGKRRGRYTSTEISNRPDGSLIAWDCFWYRHQESIQLGCNPILFRQVRTAALWVQDGMPTDDLQGEVIFAEPNTAQAYKTYAEVLKERGVLQS